MKRSKIRKLVAVLPKWMPEEPLREALSKVHNPKTRAAIERRFKIRQGAQ